MVKQEEKSFELVDEKLKFIHKLRCYKHTVPTAKVLKDNYDQY